jgi:hypothetical protein
MLVHRMAGAAWRLLRVPEMEAELLETLRDPEAPGGGLARAFLGPGAESAALARLTRYETALERSYLRSLRTLNLLRLARGVTGGPDVAGRDAAPEATATVWGETARPAKALPEPEPDWDGPGGWGSGGGGGRWDRASRYDDEPPEVVEVILDGGPDGGPVTRAEWDRLEAARHAADPGAAKGGEADNTGQTRSEADEFPNKLAPEPARGVPGRHRAAHTPPVRDWPGEPDYVPLPPEKRREPVSRVIAGPLSRFANGFER